MKKWSTLSLWVSTGWVWLSLLTLSWARVEAQTLEQLKHLSLEDLMALEVTTVTRKKQRLVDSAAAVYVITQEDIRRSGLQSIPELLRLAPGIQVARMDSSKWAISSRGFNGRYANKLLVLMDGRTVYAPLYSGVYWDIQDMVLEDIERIEVIRGPGATLWGANAVNGVINIISKSTRDTQSGLVSVGAGKDEDYSATLRYGSEIDANSSYRIYAKGFERQGGEYFSNSILRNEMQTDKFYDHWENRRVGFKFESQLSEQDDMTVQGDWYRGDTEQNIYQLISRSVAEVIRGDAKSQGGNLMLHWKHRWSDNAESLLKFYYDHAYLKNNTIEEDRHTYDFDFQSSYHLTRQEIVWGVGYRNIDDKMTIPDGSVLSFHPPNRTLELISAFVQDDISFNQDSMHLIVGTKYEHNSYTHSEWQPNIRLLWNLDDQSSLWGSVSRAVRTPSRIERDIRIRPAAPVVVYGSDGFESEKLLAYELGYRMFPAPGVGIDIAVFSNHYDELFTFEQRRNLASQGFSLEFGNNMSAKTYGAEIALKWELTQAWRLNASYSWLQVDLESDDETRDLPTMSRTDNSPEHQFQIHSYYDLNHEIELDTGLYYVSDLPNSKVDSYTRLDLRLGWKPRKDIELSFVVQNLFDATHAEFGEFSGYSFSGPQGLISTQVERNYHLKLSLNY